MAYSTRRRMVATFAFLLTVLASTAFAGPHDEVAPLMLTLRRDRSTIHLFGTVHRLTIEQYAEARTQMAPYVREAIATSEVLFLEVDRAAPRDSEQIDALMQGDPQRPSTRDLIAEWSPDRREGFLREFERFPGLPRGFSVERVIDLRPYALQMIVSSLMHRQFFPNSEDSIDSILVGFASAADVPVQGLEESVDALRAFDRVPQERYVLELEEMVGLKPSRQDVRRGIMTTQAIVYDAWREADIDVPRLTGFADALGAPPDSLAYQRHPEHEMAIYNAREAIWHRSLEAYFENADAGTTVFAAIGFAHLQPRFGTIVSRLVTAGFEIAVVFPERIDKNDFLPSR